MVGLISFNFQKTHSFPSSISTIHCARCLLALLPLLPSASRLAVSPSMRLYHLFNANRHANSTQEKRALLAYQADLIRASRNGAQLTQSGWHQSGRVVTVREAPTGLALAHTFNLSALLSCAAQQACDALSCVADQACVEGLVEELDRAPNALAKFHLLFNLPSCGWRP